MFLNTAITWTGSQPTLYSQTFTCTLLTKLSAVAQITFGSGTFDLSLQVSNDGTNWVDSGATHTTLTTATNGYLTVPDVAAKYARFVLTRLTGAATPTLGAASFSGKW